MNQINVVLRLMMQVNKNSFNSNGYMQSLTCLCLSKLPVLSFSSPIGGDYMFAYFFTFNVSDDIVQHRLSQYKVSAVTSTWSQCLLAHCSPECSLLVNLLKVSLTEDLAHLYALKAQVTSSSIP